MDYSEQQQDFIKKCEPYIDRETQKSFSNDSYYGGFEGSYGSLPALELDSDKFVFDPKNNPC